MTKKNAWVKPELIILARNQPQEAVLTGCKNDSWGSSNASNENSSHCYHSYCPAQCEYRTSS